MSSTQSHHLVIPFALTRSAGCLQAVPQLQLQHLPALLDRLQPLPVRHWDEYNYSTPHEHALAEALQWPETLRQDGQMPWAAHMARSHGMATTIPVAWGLVTPCHWQIQTDHVTMAHPQELELTLEEGQELLHAMQPWFAEEGLYLVAVPGTQPRKGSGKAVAQPALHARRTDHSPAKRVGQKAVDHKHHKCHGHEHRTQQHELSERLAGVGCDELGQEGEEEYRQLRVEDV